MAQKKYIKWIIIIGVIGYIIFWWWFFQLRNISVEKNEKSFIEKVTSNLDEEDAYKPFLYEDFYITINTDKVHVSAPIVEGVTDTDLKMGVGHHLTTPLPGEGGNIVLSGHRWRLGNNPNFTVFENIDKLQNGDKITVHYGGRDFVYEVFDSVVVNDDAVEILDQTTEPLLTIYTCTPKYTALKRLVVRARLIEE